MAAKRFNAKRAERIARSNARLNRALSLFTAGFIAEFYLLVINNYLVKGTMRQVAGAAYFLEAAVYIGLGFVAAGIVLLCLREKKVRFASFSRWLLGIGVFLTLSSELMLQIHPYGTKAMCILVPVLMLLTVVFLLYPAEFSVLAAALTVTVACCALLNRSISNAFFSGLVRGVSTGLGAILLLALFVVLKVKKQGGVLKCRRGNVAVFGENTDYALLFVVIALCSVTLFASVFAGFAYYGLWAGAVILFALAVWYTVKML